MTIRQKGIIGGLMIIIGRVKIVRLLLSLALACVSTHVDAQLFGGSKKEVAALRGQLKEDSCKIDSLRLAKAGQDSLIEVLRRQLEVKSRDVFRLTAELNEVKQGGRSSSVEIYERFILMALTDKYDKGKVEWTIAALDELEKLGVVKSYAKKYCAKELDVLGKYGVYNKEIDEVLTFAMQMCREDCGKLLERSRMRIKEKLWATSYYKAVYVGLNPTKRSTDGIPRLNEVVKRIEALCEQSTAGVKDFEAARRRLVK